VAGTREDGPLRLVATLALTGLASGLILVGVFLETRPRILRNRAEALYAAIHRVLPGTTTIRIHVEREGRLVPFESAEGGALPAEPAAYAGLAADGGLVGWAVPAAGPGFMDTIRLIYGYDPSRRVIVGLEVLDSKETPGLGDKIITDAQFRSNFESLAIDPGIVPVKHGKKTESNEVDCITGATISSEAVARILDESSRRWAPLLEAGPSTGEISRHEPRD
jgi:electron transport complex protein RnfG